MSRLIWSFLALSLICSAVLAKRLPAPVVAPITHQGVVYYAEHDGDSEVIVARDEKSGAESWRVRVYRQRVDPTKEYDVQMIFVKGMLLSKEKLLIQDEAGRCYRLDLGTRKVQGIGCKAYRALNSSN